MKYMQQAIATIPSPNEYNPSDIVSLLQEYKLSALLILSFEIGVFERLANSRMTLSEFKDKFPFLEQNALIEFLLALRLVVCQNDILKINPKYQNVLLKTGDSYIGDFARIQAFQFSRYQSLLESRVRKFDSTVWQNGLAQMTVATNRHKEVVDLILRLGAKTLLDIGGGLGLYSFEFVQRGDDQRAIIIEQGDILENVKASICSSGLKGVRVVESDADFENLPSADCVLLSNFLHGRTPDQIDKLLRKISKISDHVVINGEHRCYKEQYSVEGTLLNFTMMLNGSIGNYSIDDIERIAKDSGFYITDLRLINGVVPQIVILTKR